VARREYPLNISPESYQARTKILREQIMRKEYNFSKGKRGPVIVLMIGTMEPDPNKVCITIRLDADIVDYFRLGVKSTIDLYQLCYI
jgi:uncharacterized protein (DUF4415 family)